MGYFSTGPYGNDTALDMVGHVVDDLSDHLAKLVAAPDFPGVFQRGYASMALLATIMETCPAVPTDAEGEPLTNAAPVINALCRAYEAVHGQPGDETLDQVCARFETQLAKMSRRLSEAD